MLPVRCFTCGKVIGHKWMIYKELKMKQENPSVIFEHLQIKRYCCRRMFISHIET